MRLHKVCWIRAIASEEPAASVFFVISAISSIRRMKRVCLPRTLASLFRLYRWIANKVLYVGSWQLGVSALSTLVRYVLLLLTELITPLLW
jgi:hypothetical protein